jgi:hypothetical protein
MNKAHAILLGEAAIHVAMHKLQVHQANHEHPERHKEHELQP